MTKSVTLIQCTNTKRNETCAAQKLYDESAYFRKMRSWAKSEERDWFILSAKHGLIHPDAIVDPYDERGLSNTQAKEISFYLNDEGYDTVYLCAGMDYTNLLIPKLEGLGIDVIDNFAGLRIGERMNSLGKLAND